MGSRQWKCQRCDRWYDFSQRGRTEHIAEHDRIDEYFFGHPDIIEMDTYLEKYYHWTQA